MPRLRKLSRVLIGIFHLIEQLPTYSWDIGIDEPTQHEIWPPDAA